MIDWGSVLLLLLQFLAIATVGVAGFRAAGHLGVHEPWERICASIAIAAGLAVAVTVGLGAIGMFGLVSLSVALVGLAVEAGRRGPAPWVPPPRSAALALLVSLPGLVRGALMPASDPAAIAAQMPTAVGFVQTGSLIRTSGGFAANTEALLAFSMAYAHADLLVRLIGTPLAWGVGAGMVALGRRRGLSETASLALGATLGFATLALGGSTGPLPLAALGIVTAALFAERAATEVDHRRDPSAFLLLMAVGAGLAGGSLHLAWLVVLPLAIAAFVRARGAPPAALGRAAAVIVVLGLYWLGRDVVVDGWPSSIVPELGVALDLPPPGVRVLVVAGVLVGLIGAAFALPARVALAVAILGGTALGASLLPYRAATRSAAFGELKPAIDVLDAHEVDGALLSADRPVAGAFVGSNLERRVRPIPEGGGVLSPANVRGYAHRHCPEAMVVVGDTPANAYADVLGWTSVVSTPGLAVYEVPASECEAVRP